jgi:hypothetical protein
MTDNKKISAAIAGVMYYLREEEALMAQAAMSSMQPVAAASVISPAAASKPWGINGRQTQMQMRNLMQMRAFQRNTGG